jgi:hypothetical protein
MTIPKNPEDYAALNDFGFTAVDADVYNSSQQAITQQSTQQVADTVAAAVDDRLDSIDAILRSIRDRLGGEGVSSGFPSTAVDIQRLEKKLDDILKLQIDELHSAISGQSSSIRAVIDEVEERKEQVNTAYKTRMATLESLVLPLLYNLKKNPQKEYIYWPNRENKIQDQINAILAVTRGDVPLR